MSDLISRSALIEDLKHTKYNPDEYEKDSYGEGWAKGFNAGVDHAIHYLIYSKPVEPVYGEWIPVEERLPEESGEYLVWYDCGDDEEGCMVVNYDADIGAFGHWHDKYDSITLGFLDSEFHEFETAVAWQPLPEPFDMRKKVTK